MLESLLLAYCSRVYDAASVARVFELDQPHLFLFRGLRRLRPTAVC